MPWMKKRHSELKSIISMGGEVILTYKICQTTMQSQYRWHSKFNIPCELQKLVLVVGRPFGY